MTKRNVVKNIAIQKVNNQFHIEVLTSERAIAEMAQAEKQKKHIERVFKGDVKLKFKEERQG